MRNHSRAVLIWLICIVPLGSIFAQESGSNQADSAARDENTISREDAAVLAMSINDYPVTPGDTYALTYSVGAQSRTIEVIVENDYTVNLGPIGVINGEGLSFISLREQIREMVISSYPRSTPRLIIRSVGRFQIVIQGEVITAGMVYVNGLQRIHSVVSAWATDEALLRSVAVTSGNGRRRVYDLFRFERDGDLSQNPYLRPDDRIELQRAERTVRIEGAVRRPGRYQPEVREGLRELIERYAAGRTRGAGPITVRRYGPDGRYQVIYVDYDSNPRFALEDGDLVTVVPAYRNAPVVIVSGALYGEPHNGVAPIEIPESPVLMAVPFMEGLTVLGALRQLGGPTPYADYDAASVVRGSGDVLSFDAQDVWNGDGREIRLQPGDRVEIPFGTSGFSRSFGGPWGGN